MGQQVSVETFSATSGADGFKYWASFDPYPFKAGSKKLSYLGYLNGNGPLKGQKCVVKTIRNGSLTRDDLRLETRRAKLARETATSYNEFMGNGSHRITFNYPIITEIDQLSDCLCLADILGKPKKKIKELEYVSIELYIKGRFEDFEYGWVPQEDLVVPEAFSHFSWCRSEGNSLISNLQGVKTNSAYHLTGPVIHSQERTYGKSDLGMDGIKGFFKLHECNHICRRWPRLGDGANLKIWVDNLERKLYIMPSAPPSPLPPPYFETRQLSVPNVQNGFQTTANPVCSVGGTPNEQTRFGVDWREQFINQQTDNNITSNQMFGMHLMWYVQQLNYAFIRPPPPYCECATRIHEIAQDQKAISGLDDALDDKTCLLPPSYSECLDMNQSFTTYL